MNKSLQYLLVIFGALLLLFFVNQGQQNKYNLSTEAIFNVDENDIYKIILKESNGDSLILIKSDTTWFMPQADTLEIKDRQVNQFFEKVINGSYDMIMSKNPNKWDKFGVTDSTGKKITLFDKNDNFIESAIFSNKGQDYSHNFYRNIDSDEVYRTTENLFYMINIKPTYWGSKPKPEEQDSANPSSTPLKLNINE
tara:strand:- start:116 stop:703 length:588 start_codon:yes stop_codon:yes gene_type:complete